MKVLLTGGAGYIGSHTAVECLEAGHEVVVFDNLSNSSPKALERVVQITGKHLTFVQGDIRERAALRRLFADHVIDAVVHFAGLKAVGESVQKPLLYYDNNVAGTIALCEEMARADVKRIVFSSSATVYGDPASVPIREDFPVGATTNPYGRSKYIIEEMLRDVHQANPDWSVALLRYFNPVGAHESGLIGEDPRGIPNNLMPYIAQVASGRREYLNVFGNDYPTPDGTGVRDYIHVVDLARGHVRALDVVAQTSGVRVWNLGTGHGYSVLDMVRAFGRACGHEVPYRIVGRRPGDIAQCWADPSRAERELNWRAQYDLARMCEDTWRWQSMNPMGYEEA
ncbi:MAG: UDP-glucose 4-epimerase GalE [Hydrogenophilaceae bacterium]|nr:UDP-glucose 4-epimerase GalE [Hydrogenophilaceae bacterium]